MLSKNPEDHIFYVYIWINDDKNEIFYVGKGSKNRYKDKTERNKWFKHIINKHKCHPEIIISGLTEKEALLLERKTEIELREKNEPLVNATECGGQPPTASGKDNPNYGHKWTEEKKKQLSEKMIETKCHAGNKNGRYVKVQIEETGDIYNSIKELAELFFHTEPAKVRSSITQYGSYKGYHIKKLSA